jgi:hypothetical protein
VNDYVFEADTAELLKIYDDTMEASESGHSMDPGAQSIADYLHGMTEVRMGQVIIDLLTLTAYQAHLLLAVKLKEMES